MQQKEYILQKMKERGCMITAQRRIILDVILEEECSCCKEIYYKASEKDERIGFATVYRMVNTLEEMGAISRKNMYKIACEQGYEKSVYTVELSDRTVCCIPEEQWNDVIRAGMKACGYIEDQEVKRVVVHAEKYCGDLSL